MKHEPIQPATPMEDGRIEELMDYRDKVLEDRWVAFDLWYDELPALVARIDALKASEAALRAENAELNDENEWFRDLADTDGVSISERAAERDALQATIDAVRAWLDTDAIEQAIESCWLGAGKCETPGCTAASIRDAIDAILNAPSVTKETRE